VTRCAALVIALAASACSDTDRAPQLKPEPTPRRVIEPPEGLMRSGPPYAIRGDGVGPYKPGDSMESMQEQLRDLRIARIDLPGQQSLIRVDNEAIIIGGDPSTSSIVTFVGVLGDREVARTDAGISVGSSRAELVKAHGPELDDAEHARDPRLVAIAGMRTARFVIEGDRIAAIVIGIEARPAKRVPDVGPPPEPVCPRPPPPTQPRDHRDRGRRDLDPPGRARVRKDRRRRPRDVPAAHPEPCVRGGAAQCGRPARRADRDHARRRPAAARVVGGWLPVRWQGARARDRSHTCLPAVADALERRVARHRPLLRADEPA
jgi:hypothetical protein